MAVLCFAPISALKEISIHRRKVSLVYVLLICSFFIMHSIAELLYLCFIIIYYLYCCTAHNLLWLCIVLHRFPLWKKLAFIEERSTSKITAFIKERSKIIILYGSINIGAWAKFTHLSTPELKDCLTEERKQCPRLVRIVIFSILLFSLKATFTVLLRLLLSLLFVDNINSEMDFANRMCILR